MADEIISILFVDYLDVILKKENKMNQTEVFVSSELKLCNVSSMLLLYPAFIALIFFMIFNTKNMSLTTIRKNSIHKTYLTWCPLT